MFRYRCSGWVWLLCLGLSACGDPQQISPPGMFAYELSAAVQGTRSIVAWHGGRGQSESIFVQWLDDDGKPQGKPLSIPHANVSGSSNAYEVDLQWVEGDAVLAWYEKELRTGNLSAWLARIDRTGRVKWRQSLSGAAGSARNPVIRQANGIIHAAWIETANAEPEIWAASYNLQGMPVRAPFVAGRASRKTWNLNAALDAQGVFHVVYDAQLDTRAKELHLLSIRDDQVRHRMLSADDGYDSSYPDLAITPQGQAALTWFDQRDGNNEIYMSVTTLPALRADKSLLVRRLTHTAAASIGAYLAWNQDRLAVVWCDADLGRYQLYAQQFDVTGQPIAHIRRLTNSKSQSSIPTVRAIGRDFMVVWNEYQLGDSSLAGHNLPTFSRAYWLKLPRD